MEAEVTWAGAMSHGANVVSPAYGDGSGKHGPSQATLRCGWSVVALREYPSCTVDAAVCGNFPGHVQDVLGAELYAFL
eukprot:3938744-Alexandrium_andersonii.AAC.1